MSMQIHEEDKYPFVSCCNSKAPKHLTLKALEESDFDGINFKA